MKKPVSKFKKVHKSRLFVIGLAFMAGFLVLGLNVLNQWQADTASRALAEVTQGAEFQVNNTTAGEQSTPSVGMDDSGNFVIAFKDVPEVNAQRYDSSGAEVGGEFQVNTTGGNGILSTATDMNGSGAFVVIWDTSGQDGDGYGVFGQLFDNTGTTVGGEFQVNTTTALSQQRPVVGMDSSGNFVVIWQSFSQDGDAFGVFGQLYDNTGTKVGGEFQVNTTTTGGQDAPNVSMNADGDFIVVWDGNGPGDSIGIFGQRYDNTGTKVGSEFLVNTTTINSQGRPAIALRSSGEFVVTWESSFQDGDLVGIYAQRYDNTGTKVGGEFQVNEFTISNQVNPSIAIDTNGSFVISWSGDLQDGASLGIVAREYSSNGLPLVPEFLVNTFTTDQQFGQEIGFDNSDNYVIAWSGGGQDGSNFGVFAQRYEFPGVGDIVTIAGGGAGDRGPATNANLNSPRGSAVDSAGNTYIADFANNRIRKVDTSGNITTVAGTGKAGFSGDGGPAINARLFLPDDVAGPPSPLNSKAPVPATVVITPEVSTLRIRLLLTSAMNRFPAPSKDTDFGLFKRALVAGPLSPLNPGVPLPATVVIVPVVSILRIRSLAELAIYILPLLSTATSSGEEILALVAAPPSPLKPDTPSPATVVIIPVVPSTLRIR